MSPSLIDMLSQEIIDEILEAVADFLDIEHLKACSLDNKTGVPGSFRHRTPKSALLRILNANPRLTTYIRELKISIPPSDPSWIIMDPDVLHIISHFSGETLESLILNGELVADEPEVREHIKRLLAILPSSISSFTIACIPDFPVDAFARFKSLSRISIFCVSSAGVDCWDHTSDAFRPVLRTLDMSNSASFVNELSRHSPHKQSALDLSKLEVFRSDIESHDDLACVQEMIEVAHRSLKKCSLVIGCNFDYKPLPELPRLDGCSNLTTLEIQSMLRPATSYFKEIIGVLETLPTRNRLQELRLRIIVAYSQRAEDQSLSGSWEVLYKQVRRLSSRRRVTVRIHVEYSNLDFREGSKKTHSVVRRLFDEGIIQIESTSESHV